MPRGSVSVGNFSFVDAPLTLGELKGNEFTVVLRRVSAAPIDAVDVNDSSGDAGAGSGDSSGSGGSNAAVEAALRGVRNNGFVNYFGMQRFGTGNVPTYKIGEALLKGDWARAVSLVLLPFHDTEPPATARAREYLYKTHDCEKAASLWPRHQLAESAVLRALATSGGRAVKNAINAIPQSLRTMYVHAYQSFVWNHMVSERLLLTATTVEEQAEDGAPRVGTGVPSTPIVGDLVYVDAAAADDDATAVAADEDGDATTAAAADVSTDAAAGSGSGSGSSGDRDFDEKVHADNIRTKVKALTAADVASGKYTIADVVMPVPGMWCKSFLCCDVFFVVLRFSRLFLSLLLFVPLKRRSAFSPRWCRRSVG
jgi:tRNA pseudouridine13 synthase